jgi:hypothetical protein
MHHWFWDLDCCLGTFQTVILGELVKEVDEIARRQLIIRYVSVLLNSELMTIVHFHFLRDFNNEVPLYFKPVLFCQLIIIYRIIRWSV